MNIKELILLTDDLTGTKLFYSEKLKFSILSKDESSISFNVGKSKLTFINSENVNPQYHFAFNIPNNKLYEAKEWIKEKHEILETSKPDNTVDFENWKARSFYFFDNNRNILEFATRFDLNNFSIEKFNETQILSISEIGIPVDDVIQTGDELKQEHGLQYFSKQKPTEMFSAFGDDNGLLIIVKNKRNWYPTQISANKYYTEIIIEDNSREINLSF